MRDARMEEPPPSASSDSQGRLFQNMFRPQREEEREIHTYNMYIPIYTFTRIHTQIYTYIHSYVYIYTHISVYALTYVYIYIHISGIISDIYIGIFMIISDNQCHAQIET